LVFYYSIIFCIGYGADGCFWPNPADGVQDSSLLIYKTHEFSLLVEAAPLQTFAYLHGRLVSSSKASISAWVMVFGIGLTIGKPFAPI
jgi:hypothetical protein